jgi:hypothetical protein
MASSNVLYSVLQEINFVQYIQLAALDNNYCHNHRKYHLFPVPIIYVLVPCSVMGPGLEHNTRIIRDESLETEGIVAAIRSLNIDVNNSH